MKMTVERLRELQKASDEARRAVVQAKDQYDEETVLPKIKKLVGKYLVYRRSCYSCPSNESDYWDIYGRVSAADGARLTLVTAEVDSRGNPILTNRGNVSFDGSLPAGWSLSTRGAFEREVRRVKKLLGIK